MTVQKVFFNGKLYGMEDLEKGIEVIENTNRLELKDKELTELIYANMLCNDTKVDVDGNLTGDPTETALVDMAFKLNFDPSIYD